MENKAFEEVVGNNKEDGRYLEEFKQSDLHFERQVSQMRI